MIRSVLSNCILPVIVKVKGYIYQSIVVKLNHVICISISNCLLLSALLNQINDAHPPIGLQFLGKVQFKGLLGLGNPSIEAWWWAILVARLAPVDRHGSTHLGEGKLVMTE